MKPLEIQRVTRRFKEMTITNNIQEAKQALTDGKIVKTQHNGLEVRVLKLIPGLFGYSWEVVYAHVGLDTAKHDSIMENTAFSIYA